MAGEVLLLYTLGFGGVWAAVLCGCLAGGLRSRSRRDWNRAFVHELSADAPEVRRDLAQRWASDLT